MPSSSHQDDQDLDNLPFVIGAGLGRTGTHSLRAALMELGYNRPYHMEEILGEARAPPEKWFKLAQSERSTGTQNHTLALQVAQSVIDQGYTATADYPACLLYEEFLQLKPNGKVILSVRRSPQDWKKSVLETIGILSGPLSKPPFSLLPFFRSFTNHLDPWVWERTGVAKLGQITSHNFPKTSLLAYQDSMESAYTRWIESVQARVPADQLLIHHASEGYGPICDLLGVVQEDCPTKKYPYISDTEEIKQSIRHLDMVTKVFWPLVVVSVLVVVSTGYNHCFLLI